MVSVMGGVIEKEIGAAIGIEVEIEIAAATGAGITIANVGGAGVGAETEIVTEEENEIVNVWKEKGEIATVREIATWITTTRESESEKGVEVILRKFCLRAPCECVGFFN